MILQYNFSQAPRRLSQQGRNVDRNCRQEREEFCIFPCNVCSLVSILSRPPRPPPRSATLSSYRFSLASPFLFYFWLSVSVRSRGSPGTRGPSKDASRFPLPPVLPSVPATAFHLNVSSVFCPLVSSPALSFFTFILHRITLGDDGIPESKTRSFEFVEILKDVVDLLSSTVPAASTFSGWLCHPLFSLSPIDPPTSCHRSTPGLLLLTDLCRFNLRYRRSCRRRYHCRRRRRRRRPLLGLE